MFVLEVFFKSPPVSREVVFLKRPSTLLGASEEANITFDELNELGCDIRITRQIGRSFRLTPEGRRTANCKYDAAIEGLFDKEVELNLDKVSLRVIAIDTDLLMREEETPDRAGVRILRQAFSKPSPQFPAVTVEHQGNPSFSVSFAEGSALLIGRASDCTLRIDAPEISSHHARIGYEAGSFWVEDLGSTNGTFIADKQISSRTFVPLGHSVRLAQNVEITCQSYAETGRGRRNESRLTSLTKKASQNQELETYAIPDSRVEPSPVELATSRYPCLISVSELCRPARVALKPGAKVQIGREQGCDMWLGAPHVSRHHAEVLLNSEGTVAFSDTSTNGTKFDGGLLKRGDILTLQHDPRVFDFGEGITLAICFDEAQEERYRTSSGALTIFRRKVAPRQLNKDGHEAISAQSSVQRSFRGKTRLGWTGSISLDDWLNRVKSAFQTLGILGSVLVFVSLSLIFAILVMLWLQF